MHHAATVVAFILALFCLTLALMTPWFVRGPITDKVTTTVILVIMGLVYLAAAIYG